MEMTVSRFDEWYDSEVIRLTNELPDPNKYRYAEIRMPVMFPASLQMRTAPPVSDTIKLHSVNFSKMWDRKQETYYWERNK